MSNFLTGVVRRGAGLAMPVTVRPARGPEQVPAAVPASAEALPGIESEGRALSERPANSMTSESMVQSAVQPEPRHESSFLPLNRISSSRAEELETHTTVRPKVEINRLEVAEKTEVRVANDQALAIQPSGLERDSAEPTLTVSPVKETKPRTEEPRTSQMKSLVRPVSEISSVERKTSPKQERQAVAPAPARAESARASHAGSQSKATPEKKSINVKIGRVEIRSAQPAPVVQRPRATTSTGFDDARLSRLYLDRNMR